jgi:hypothetical protein
MAAAGFILFAGAATAALQRPLIARVGRAT